MDIQYDTCKDDVGEAPDADTDIDDNDILRALSVSDSLCPDKIGGVDDISEDHFLAQLMNVHIGYYENHTAPYSKTLPDIKLWSRMFERSAIGNTEQPNEQPKPNTRIRATWNQIICLAHSLQLSVNKSFEFAFIKSILKTIGKPKFFQTIKYRGTFFEIDF